MHDEGAAPLRRDPQNQYRHGVLIRNHVEDRFGNDLVRGHGKNFKTGVSEMKSRHTLSSSVKAYYFPRKTTDDLIQDREQKHFQEYSGYNKRGVKGYIFFGHGANQETFDKRDFGTSNTLFFDKRMKTEEVIHPHYYHDYKGDQQMRKTRDLDDKNRLTSLPPPLLSNTVSRYPKAHADSTKLFDRDFMKTGLRH